MTTDVDQGYFVWSQEELTQRDASTGVTISQMLDHGSVSFGKFEFESLSWEKWSVFRHDRRQEELEKFNGLVAEKKAYFEEYYKRMRALKALQQQQQQQEEQAQQQIQQTELTLDYSVDGSLSEEEQETATGRKMEAEMETEKIIEERRKDPEGCTVAENPSVGDTKSEMPIVGDVKGSDKRGSRIVSKRLIERKTISKEPSSSTRFSPGPKQNSRPQTRPVVHKPQPQPPPLPPPRKITGKTNNISNLKVRTKEATRTIPIASTATTSAIATPRRPSSSASATRTIPIASTATTSTIATPKRPSSSASMRRPPSASGTRPSSTPRRPLSSAGDRGGGMREKMQRSDLSSNRVGAVTHGKMGPSVHGTPRMNIIPSTIKSITPESKRQVSKEPLVLNNNSTSVKRIILHRQVSKEPLVLNNNSTSVKRPERYILDAQKSRSINLPPKKNPSSSGASETFSRNKTKEAPSTTQPRSTTRNNVTPARSSVPVRNATPSRVNDSNKIGTQKPIPPRTSETPRVGSRHPSSSSSVNARKPKVETKTWR